MILLGCHGVISTSLHFSRGFGYFLNSGNVNGAGLLSTVCCLSVAGDRLGTVSSRLVRRSTRIFVVQNSCRSGNVRFRISTTIGQQRGGHFSCSNGSCPQVSSRVNHVPTILISPTSRRLVTRNDRRHEHFISSIVSRCSQLCLRTLIHCGRTLRSHGSLLGRSRVPSTAVLSVCRRHVTTRTRRVCHYEGRFVSRFRPLFRRCCGTVSNKHRRINLGCASRYRHNSLHLLLTRYHLHSRTVNCAAQNSRGSSLRVLLSNCPVGHAKSRKRGGACLVTLGVTRFHLLHRVANIVPVLLLSSVFSELSSRHITGVLGLITSSNFKRVFVASAGHGRVHRLISGFKLRTGVCGIVGNGVGY